MSSAATATSGSDGIYSQCWERWDLSREEPMEGRLEKLLQGAVELKEAGNALYRRQELKEAQHAYDKASSILLIPAIGDFFSPHYREQFQALSSTLYANKAAVYFELGELQTAEKSCSHSLLLKESAKVYLRRGRIQEARLDCPEIVLRDYRAAARLDDEGSKAREARSRAERLAAELGTDSGGHTCYAWQKKWVAGGVPRDMVETVESLLRPEAIHRGWGELRAHPGPDSDIRWEDLCSANEETKNEFFSLCYRAILMFYFPGVRDGRVWQDLSCVHEWARELWVKGFQLDPHVALSLGNRMMYCRGFPVEDAAKGFRLLNEVAEGRHDFMAKEAPGHLQGDACVFGPDKVRSLRSGAIETLLGTQEAFKFGCGSLPDLLNASFLKALYRIGCKELKHNKIQWYYAKTFSRGDVWPADFKKLVKWLEKAAANPYPEPNAKAMVELAVALATGCSVEHDLGRAEKLARAAMAHAIPGSEDWNAGQKLLAALDGAAGRDKELFRRYALMSSKEEAKRSRKCSHCGKAQSAADDSGGVARNEAAGTKLKECSRCRLVSYCSKECQAAAWPKHKKVCGKA